MTRDEEVIQSIEEKAGTILGKAQEFLTTALPGGPGAFAYVVVSSLVGKLFGNARKYVEEAVSRPITLPDFIYVEPLDEELEEFFNDGHLQSIRSEFPERYEDFSNNDWLTMRRYYKPLYYTLTVKEPLVTEMFSFEIQSQNYKRIIYDFDLFPLYKKAIQSVPSASRQNALWSAVTSILKGTVKEMWSKDYAKQLFKKAKADPEVAGLIEDIKTKVGEKVDVDQVLKLGKETLQYVAGRSISPEGQAISNFPIKAMEYVTKVLPDGKLSMPAEVTRTLHLRTDSTVRVLIFSEE